MSISKDILSPESYQYLLSNSKIFEVERILKQTKSGELKPEQARIRLELLLNLESESTTEQDFEEQSENEIVEIELENSFEAGFEADLGDDSVSFENDGEVFLGDEISFQSDDEYEINLDSGISSNNNSFKIQKAGDEVSKIFDFYMSKPVVGNSFSNANNSGVVDTSEFGSQFKSTSGNNSSFRGGYLGGFGNNFGGSFGQNQTQYKPVPMVDWSEVTDLNNCVILYRTHAQSRALEEIFLKYKLPYRLVSGTRFLDRKEVKDIIAMLRFMVNSSDKLSLSRFLPLVMTGVGPKTLERILAYLEDYEYPLAPKFQSRIMELMSRMQSVWSSSRTLVEMVKELMFVTGYDRYLKDEYPVKEEREERIDNIKELYSLMLPFDEQTGVDLQSKLSAFLTQIALMSMLDNSQDKDEPKISLMSLHQSKGLEFETVFLVGCEDGLLPHQNSFLESKDMEEEVRLAYVGVTRAKSNLYLTSASSRVYFGQIKVNPVSRIFRNFLDKNCKRVNW
jgi:UvrD-like helicase C-terminal domain